jgi:hypothetical protein
MVSLLPFIFGIKVGIMLFLLPAFRAYILAPGLPMDEVQPPAPILQRDKQREEI